MVSLAAGRGAAAAFLVLGLAFLVIAMGIGRASRQWAEPDHATQRPANKRFRLARHGVRFESRRSARS
jgi:hypothetical protein